MKVVLNEFTELTLQPGVVVKVGPDPQDDTVNSYLLDNLIAQPPKRVNIPSAQASDQYIQYDFGQ